MASPGATAFPSTKETTNYARLCRLLVDIGSQALRDTFDAIHPPAGLPTVLGRHLEHATLQSLEKKRVLNPTQWGKLYPTSASSVSSADFDITLLMVLLRNICGLLPPSTGWDRLPPSTDRSTQANIARLKYYRNTVYAHASQASVDDVTFNTYWQNISNAILGLVGASYGAAISKLKNECIDPDTEEHYRQLLKQWKENEDNIKEMIRDIEGQVKSKVGDMDEKMEKMDEKLEKMDEKLETLVAQQEETKEQESTREKLREMKGEIQTVKQKLDDLVSGPQPKKRSRMEGGAAAALAECLKENTSLTHLNLSYNEIGDDGAAALAECLKENTSLTDLNLDSNEIGYDGAAALAQCLKKNTSLRDLYLCANEIGGDGAAALAEGLKENTSLRDLNLGYNGIGDVGAAALAECLKENTSLTDLKLRSNFIRYDGAAALAECLKENESLRILCLDLENNEISEAGAAALAESVKENSSLTIDF